MCFCELEGLQMEEYKEKIIELVSNIGNLNSLQFIYTFIYTLQKEEEARK